MTEREAFTARVLSALVTELADAKETVERIEASIVALAKEYGVPKAHSVGILHSDQR
jgi:hypothetical protein